MATETNPQAQDVKRGEWATQDRLSVDDGDTPQGVTTINVEGKQAIGALQGFGQLWKKSYTVSMPGINKTPKEVMDVWKAHFPEFQPPGNRFYPPKDGIAPGKVMIIDSPLPVVPPLYDRPGVVPMTSGVMVLFSDDNSFGVMTPEGFPVAGWNNFSVYEDDNDTIVAQVLSFERASDPIYEFGFRFMGGANRQEFIWVTVLTKLAEYFGVRNDVTRDRELVDPRIQWKYFRRMTQNAGIRTTLYKMAAPARWVKGLFNGKAQ